MRLSGGLSVNTNIPLSILYLCGSTANFLFRVQGASKKYMIRLGELQRSHSPAVSCCFMMDILMSN